MVIILDKPISLGDIAPGTYPHCYVTNFYVNGPAVMVQVSYEFGEMKAPTAENPSGWHPCPAFFNKQFQLTGEQLLPFFTTHGDSTGYLWDEVESAIYTEIQKQDARAAGKLGLGYEQASSDSQASSGMGTDSSGSAPSSSSDENTSATPAAN